MSKKGEKKPESGLAFPVDVKGERSTTLAGKAIIAAAIRGANTVDAQKYASACEREKNWRFNYQKHYFNMVKVSAASAEAALGVANAGINYMHNNFQYVDPKDSTKFESFASYMSKPATGYFTGVIEGTKTGNTPLVVPYKGKSLQGTALKDQLQKWATRGTIEPDAAATISRLADKDLDLHNLHFVLIGAGSAMGPFIKLLEHGATVIAIDIPGAWGPRPAEMWKRLIDTARASRGKLLFPLSKEQKSCATDAELFAAAGCNLTEQPANILAWLSTVAPNARLTIGNYTYLDGELHVKLSLAADGVIQGLVLRRPDTAVAFLCTPTDLHFIPDIAYQAAVANYGFHPGRLLEALINLLTLGKCLRKNALKPITAADGSSVKLVDGLSVAQGPNYALAKRLQHWRAIVEYSAGRTVSSHIAPSTATLSVVSNKSFGWAYGGMPYFKPYEIFQQETTNAVMGALLAADVTQADSPSNPANRSKYGIKNPLEIFKYNSVHGGVWRAAYQVDSIGEVSVLIHFLGGPKLFLPVMALILAAIAGAVCFFVL